MSVTADALDLLAGDPPRYPHVPGDFHRHPETGAPYVNHPTDTTKDGRPRRVMYGRPSSFGAALDNPFSLIKWKDRKELIGAAVLELDYEYILANRENDKILDGLAAQCYDAADAHLAADQGTHIHRLCEHADKSGFIASLFDDGEALGIPRALQLQIVEQWVRFRQRHGLTALAVEQTVVNDRWRLAGTLDRLDVADRDILTAYGILEAGVPFVGDIKTGGLTLGNDGQPNYWVKYPVQLAAYVDAVPYDTETDERGVWRGLDGGLQPPNPHIALIYHYDLARALAGEVVDWVAIPVNVDAGREGGDLCRAAADFAKRRDLFAMPAPTNADQPARASGLKVDQAGDETLGQVRGQDSGVDVKTPSLASPANPSAPDPSALGQPAADPEPPIVTTAGGDGSAANVPPWHHLKHRVIGLVCEHPEAEALLRQQWPEGVPTLKHEGHTDDELEQILAVVRRVEAEVGIGWNHDDARHDAIQRARQAWAESGRSEDDMWFCATLIATYEQCRNAYVTIGGLVAQFTIEQADRLRESATNH